MHAKYMRTFEDFGADTSAKGKSTDSDEADPAWLYNYIQSGEPFGVVSAYLPNVSPDESE